MSERRDAINQNNMLQERMRRRTSLYQSQNNDHKYDEDDEDDDYLPEPTTDQFQPPRSISFGPGRGRSSPSQRKAMGKSGSGSAMVYVCTNCGAEYVNWVGRCSTCRQWNTVQEMRVGRSKGLGGGGGEKARPVFQREGAIRGGGSVDNGVGKPMSWLTGLDCGNNYGAYKPVSITDVYNQMGYKNNSGNDEDGGNNYKSLKENRIKIPFDDEFSNVLGGGIMPGSLTLLGGDPGVGKSTLLLQTAGYVASLSSPPRKIGHGRDDDGDSGLGPVLYVSGEENSMQIATRAMRLGIEESELLLMCETDADFIAESVVMYCNDVMAQEPASSSWHSEKPMQKSGVLVRRKRPSLLIIDSIQTMLCDNGGSSSAGGVTQVRECVNLFLRLAKSTGVPIILVGHVTKSGGVAGPRTVEHMVDTVLYLEGMEYHGGGPNIRMLRSSKNRFGSSEEVGMYSGSSTDEGRLIPISDPSSLLLRNRMDSSDVEGCAVSLLLEGIRPMTVEVQALVTPAGPPSYVGRRTVDGIAVARLQLILAVLQKRCGISFGRQDVYINVVGGISLRNSKQDGTSSDLAIAIALVSSLYNIPVRSDTAFVGEIGLLGELRQPASLEKRVNEARRMGFSAVVIPKQRIAEIKNKRGYKSRSKSIQSSTRGIDCIEAQGLKDAIEKGLTEKIPKKKARQKNFKKAEKGKMSLYEDFDDLIIDDDDDNGDDDDDDDYFDA